MKKINIIFFLFLFLINACSKEEKKIAVIKETKQDLEMITAYKEGYRALNEGDPYFAAKKFLEAELLFPQSDWAPRSALMASYSYYMQNYYAEAIANLERYLKTYPTDKNLSYAHYLIAMCYYETIEDEKRDSGPLIKAKDKFNYVVESFYSIATKFNFKSIQTPILENQELFMRSVGEHTDIVSKEMYSFVDKNESILCLRPEATSGIARFAALNYQTGSLKFSTHGPMFQEKDLKKGDIDSFIKLILKI